MKENTPIDSLELFKETAREVLGDSLDYTINADSTLVLCQSIRRGTEPPQPQQVKYCVIDLKTNQLLYKSHLANGSVKWYGQKELQVRNFKGFPTVNEEGIYIYHLETKKRTKYGEYPSQTE